MKYILCVLFNDRNNDDIYRRLRIVTYYNKQIVSYLHVFIIYHVFYFVYIDNGGALCTSPSHDKHKQLNNKKIFF